MNLLRSFFAADSTSLKICGVITAEDASALNELGVDAIGINFWSKTKRYCSFEQAQTFSPSLAGCLLRVGVFVNASSDFVRSCFSENLIDVAQFHGDESLDYLSHFQLRGYPYIRSVNLKEGVLPSRSYGTSYLLLDAHAPKVYGGTGNTINWNHAAEVVTNHPEHSVLLAGGITPSNAAEAIQTVRPCAIDIASGAEMIPGRKDLQKVKDLVATVRVVNSLPRQ